MCIGDQKNQDQKYTSNESVMVQSSQYKWRESLALDLQVQLLPLVIVKKVKDWFKEERENNMASLGEFLLTPTFNLNFALMLPLKNL